MIRTYGEEAGYRLLSGGLQGIAMLTGGALGGDVVFTRNSIGWDWGMAQYAIDVPRLWNGSLIVEPERTNYHDSVENWTLFSSAYPVTAGQSDPGGGTNGYLVERNASENRRQNNTNLGYYPSINYYSAVTALVLKNASTATYTFGASGRNPADTGYNPSLVDYRISDGAIQLEVDATASVTDLGSWVLIRSHGTLLVSDISASNDYAAIRLTLNTTGTHITIAGASGYGNIAATPIVTLTTPITRAADYVSQDLTGVVTTVHQVHIDAELAWGIGPSGFEDEYQVLRSMDDGTGNNGVEIVRRHDNTLRLRVINGGSVTVDQSLGTVTDGERVKVFVGHDGTDFYAQKTGGTLVQVTAALPSGRIERIGSRGHTDGAQHAHSGANHYTHVVYPDILSVSIGQAFIG